MEQRRRLRIASRRWETPDTATFTLEPADGLPLPDYLPGQFLSLIFNTFGTEKRRAYSFSSSPDADALPAITVKRVVNGEFSNRLLSYAQAGDLLDAAGPSGQFTLPDPLPDTLVFLAAGSGITPVFSQMKSLLGQAGGPRVLLFYVNRDSRHTIFKAQIDRWIEVFPDRFECLYFFSREKNAAHSHFGHLSNTLFESLLHERFGERIPARSRRETVFFLCAPVALMRMAEMTLRLLDFPAANIRKEVFQPDSRLPLRTVDTGKTHRIVASGRGENVDFQAYEGETILNAALRQGIDLPYTCKSGVCLTCLARCTAGLVDVAFVETTRRNGPGDMVNTCIGYAVSEEVELRYE